MTLIELTVAMAIVTVLFSVVVMGVGTLTGQKAKSAAGELAGTIRALYDTASLSGKVCRLVFQLPKAASESGFQYWAECGPGTLTARVDRDQALRDDTHAKDLADKLKAEGAPERGKSTFQDLMAGEKDRVEKDLKFQSFTAENVKPRKVPSVNLAVWTRHQRDAVQTGLAYLYFFPQGYTERAQVYFRQGKNVWTVTVAPLTGKATVVGDELEVPKS
jgi:general secretion pathway protein H